MNISEYISSLVIDYNGLQNHKDFFTIRVFP